MGILPIPAGKDGNDSHDPVRIKSSELRTAIEKGLEILGKSSVKALVSELGRRGIDLDNASARYDLDQIEAVLIQIFGQDATALMIERIRLQVES